MSMMPHNTLAAFAKFLRAIKDPTALDVYCKGHLELVDGAILIWGAVAPEGRDSVMNEYDFADVLSVDTMLADLHVGTPQS
jgi:hypothetical protein